MNVCRSCGKGYVKTIMSLGDMPLANSLLTFEQTKEKEPKYPLDLAFCSYCGLVQITETIPPDVMFRDYLYFSSFSETMLRHSNELAERLIIERNLGSDSLVVEIGSNDGYLLQYYKKAGIKVLGVEPAKNIAVVAEQRGIPTLSEFFDETLAQRLGKCADVIHIHNVLAHIDDLNGFLAGVRLMLKDKGVLVVEVPYIRDMIDCCEFDTIYHEHLCYFSLTALCYLMRRSDLMVRDIERLPIHGGSLRLFIVPIRTGPESISVTSLLDEEDKRGVNQWEFYANFAQRSIAVRERLCFVLADLKRRGASIVAYGAAAKGSTLLNFCHIGQETLDFVVDRSTYKQGHYMPGVHLPIYSPEMLLQKMPQYTLLLTWNFAQEIMQQQEEYCKRGGRFIIPIPNVEVV